MPQIWLSYEEVAGFLGCAKEEAPARIALAQWPRRRCSDGLTRAKLPAFEAEAFVRDCYLAEQKVAGSHDKSHIDQDLQLEASGSNHVLSWR